MLSVPVLLYKETLQEWLGFSVLAFPSSGWINRLGGHRAINAQLLRRVDLSIPEFQSGHHRLRPNLPTEAQPAD